MRLYHLILSFLVLLSTPLAVQAAEINTGFEFSNTSGFFTLTNDDAFATFNGGEAKSVGNFSLYHTGANAWMISPGATGSIDLIGTIRTSDPETSHGVEFGRIINVINSKSSFNNYFMSIQIGNGGSKFRHFIMDDTDLFDFAIKSLQASAMVKVHYSERFSYRNLFGQRSMSYVSEIEMVNQDNTD